MNSEEMIKKLREEAIAVLKEVPDGIRINLKKDQLDKMIFDKVVVDEEKGIYYKVPVWTGPFLSKLDLSEVDFENVAWSIDEKPNASDIQQIKKILEAIKNGKVEDYPGGSISYVNEGGMYKDLSNTNANIDFSKSFEAKYFNAIRIYKTNLSNVDLSNNNCDIRFLDISDSDVSNTNINISKAKCLFIMNSNLENVDLSYLTMEAVDNEELLSLRSGEEDNEKEIWFQSCNLCNTGLNITLSEEMEKEYYESYHKPALEEVSGIKDNGDGTITQTTPKPDSDPDGYANYATYADYIKNYANLEGCRLNGEKIWPGIVINPDEVLKAMREQIKNIR